MQNMVGIVPNAVKKFWFHTFYKFWCNRTLTLLLFLRNDSVIVRMR